MSGVLSVKEFGLGVRVRPDVPVWSNTARRSAAVDKGMKDVCLAFRRMTSQSPAPRLYEAAMLKAHPSPAG